ncbi:MAG: hypothetical protein HY788_22445 [Deltaproteobacteria bacterium]|nr:hypothetical protein [Deltaproteobacteria bacterium]
MTEKAEKWRLLEDWRRLVPAAGGLAVDDLLAYSISDFGSPPILHLYTFEPAAIVGKYQDIHAALKLDRCRERGVAFNRRSTGGGTVIMGPDVVALGFGISLRDKRIGSGVGGVFRVMSGVLVRALERLGVSASFRPKNDLEVAGKKLAGLSASAEVGDCVLFHASILVDFDVNLMLDIMNTPAQKIYDKGYSCFSERLTTIRKETHRDVTMDEAIHAIRSSFEESFGIRFVQSELTPPEREKAADLEKGRYCDEHWIFSHRHPPSNMGEALVKTPGGLLQVYLSTAGHAIDQVIITGDFFSTTEQLNRLESALKWTLAEPDRILQAIREVWEPDLIYGVSPEALRDAIVAAKTVCDKAQGPPYSDRAPHGRA